jgi:hypothetical protein
MSIGENDAAANGSSLAAETAAAAPVAASGPHAEAVQREREGNGVPPLPQLIEMARAQVDAAGKVLDVARLIAREKEEGEAKGRGV